MCFCLALLGRAWLCCVLVFVALFGELVAEVEDGVQAQEHCCGLYLCTLLLLLHVVVTACPVSCAGVSVITLSVSRHNNKCP